MEHTQTETEEELFLKICQYILEEGNLPENEVEDKAHQILDDPKKYRWYLSFFLYETHSK